MTLPGRAKRPSDDLRIDSHATADRGLRAAPRGRQESEPSAQDCLAKMSLHVCIGGAVVGLVAAFVLDAPAVVSCVQ